MLREVEMEDIILVKTANNKDILLSEPFLSSKDRLEFKTCSIIDLPVFYDVSLDRLIFKCPNKSLGVKLSEDDSLYLMDIHKKELDSSKKFYGNLVKDSIIFKRDGDLVYCDEIIDNCFNQYYLDLIVYIANNKLKQNFKDYNEFQLYTLDKMKDKNKDEVSFKDL